nr:immune-associated nucleotide-binding protein 12-like isoform X1 [Paramormyrops kingsleyae]
MGTLVSLHTEETRSFTQQCSLRLSCSDRGEEKQQRHTFREKQGIMASESALGRRTRSHSFGSRPNMSDAPAEVRIVLLGKTGSGKSSAGNVILGEEKFKVSCVPYDATTDCQTEEGNVNGRKITVTDTPGIFDTGRSEKDLKYSIISCLSECAPGPHAFILVLTVGRYTREEKESVKMILKWFGEEALKHTVVLFTHGDELHKNETIKEFVDKNKDLKELVDKCERRVHVIDSKHWNRKDKNAQSADLLEQLNKMMKEKREAGESQAVQALEELKNQILQQRSSAPDQEPGQGSGRPTRSDGNLDESDYRSNSFQIKQLLMTIENMVKGNEGRCYTNESLQLIAEAIQDEVNKIIQDRMKVFFAEAINIVRRNRDSMTESQKLDNIEAIGHEIYKIIKERNTEIQKEARERIRNKIFKSEVAGAAVGSLLGLMHGVAVGAAVPFVALAGLFTAGVKSILGSRSEEPEVNPRNIAVAGAVEEVAGIAGAAAAVGATAGAAAAAGATAVGTAGAAIGAGAATGVGLVVAGGVYAIAGAVRGGMAGAKAGETCVGTNRAAKEAAEAAGQAGLSTLKGVWDATQKLARSKESPYNKPL